MNKNLFWKCGGCRHWTPDLGPDGVVYTTRCSHCNLPRPDVVEYRRVRADPPIPTTRRDPVTGVVLIVAGLVVVGIAGNWGLALGLLLIVVGREMTR